MQLERRHLPLLSSSLLELPKFLPCPLGAHSHTYMRTIARAKNLNITVRFGVVGDDGSVRVSKTGLGSSAAMTTALCGALLHTMGCVDLLATNDRPRIDEHYRKIHNVAQLAHAIAQGKVGSGFDVSSAVYGTQIYQRFDPENINRAFDMLNVLDSTPGSDATIAKQVFDFLVDRSVWTEQRARFQLPPGLDIVLGDVCGGSSSSSMVHSYNICYQNHHDLFQLNIIELFRPRRFLAGERVPRLKRMEFGRILPQRIKPFRAFSISYLLWLPGIPVTSGWLRACALPIPQRHGICWRRTKI